MDANNFRRFWQQNFSDCLPVSYLLKYNLADRWFRFHSLPESKRYADDEAEVTELLARQNAVLLDVIGTDHDCILVSGNYAVEPMARNLTRCLSLAEFQFQEFVRLPKQDFDPEDLEPDGEPLFLSLFCGTHKCESVVEKIDERLS